MEYLLAAAIVAAMTATPIPLPPSWLLLAYLAVEFDASPALMVVAGAAGAAAGRTILALTARTFGPRLLSRSSRENLDVLADVLHRRKSTWGVAAVLAASPPPAGALYTAAGLLRIDLRVVAASCFVGRLVTYGIGVAVVGGAADDLADRLRAWVGPWSVILGLLLVAGALWLLTLIDWRATIERRRPRFRHPVPSRR
ncbi:MAG: hypothetical protein AB7V62_03015 [Thermoleophilia bacterium]